MTRDDILAVLDRRSDALKRRDMDAYALLYSEAAEVESPLAGTARGREAAVQSTRAFMIAFPDIAFTDEEPIIDGDRAALVSEIAGTDVNGILGHEPSGRAFRFPISVVLTIRDHHIVRERRIYDFTGLLIQIGVLKAKPA